jgi:hypothetical protein
MGKDGRARRCLALAEKSDPVDYTSKWPRMTTDGVLSHQIQSVVAPYLGERTQKVLEAVCQRMVGVPYHSISVERLGSLIYWLRIFLRSKNMIEDAPLERLASELEKLRSLPGIVTTRNR